MSENEEDLPGDPMLDQSEIDRLLSMASEPAKPRIYRADGRRHDTDAALKVESYDFRNPVFLTEVDLRRLRLLHEDFIRYLSARLALFLRMECSLKMAKLTTLTYAKFTEGLPNPTHLCLFKAEPLSGVGILDINPPSRPDAGGSPARRPRPFGEGGPIPHRDRDRAARGHHPHHPRGMVRAMAPRRRSPPRDHRP